LHRIFVLRARFFFRCHRRALGVSLYAMLTGAPPFVGDTLMATCAALLMLAAVCSALARALT
jgi:hypothetical protein